MMKVLKYMPIAVPVLVFFVFNMLTPFWWDDFKMACFFKPEGGWLQTADRLLASFSDIVSSTYNMYMTHHGRSPVDFTNFLFMFLKHKIIFNICNTIVYSLLVFLICFHIKGSRRNPPLLFLLVTVLLWMWIPGWGQDFLWLTGSLNYLWTSAMILLFLVPYRKKLDDPSYTLNKFFSIVMFFAGILAGWSMENSAVGCGVILFAYFVIKIFKKERITLFEILGSIGFLIGFLLLIHSRKTISVNNIAIFSQVKNVTRVFLRYGGLITILAVLLGVELVCFRKKKIPVSAYLYFLALIFSVYSMVLSSYFTERTFMMPGVFLIITLLSLICKLLPEIKRRYIVLVLAVLLVEFVPSFYYGTKSIVSCYLLSQARDRYIQTEKEKGNLEIKVKTPIRVTDRHSGLYDGQDFFSSRLHPDFLHQNSAKNVWYDAEISGIKMKSTLKDYFERIKREHLTLGDLLDEIYKDW
jgi:hypothetical protein